MTHPFQRTRLRRSLGVTALALTSFASVACGGDDNKGSGGTAGVSGNAGDAGSAGSSGSAGNAGSAGSAGSSGSAGNAGSAGAGGPVEGDLHYRVDQFGYLPDEQKVAVIGVATTGFNAPDTFAGPGSTLEVRSATDDSVVFSGAPVQWNAGAEDALAGDRGYWFDFSSVTAPGEYYLADPSSGSTSVHFRIAADVYDDVLVQAMRTFFYQREGFAKAAPYADERWTDGASHANDQAARSVFDKANVATERDVSGGVDGRGGSEQVRHLRQ